MRQYVYISTAEHLDPGDVSAILESCQRNNAARNVTGLLLYNGRNFLQLLEGEGDDLHWIMRRITSDGRHHGISRLYDEPAAERACPDWLMKRIALGDPGEARRARLEEELPAGLDPLVRRIILNFALLN
ncbi:BLUF domain-containing protein [Parerythrobacter aurantius]|uniref:BLUF domain-containing protein n=1 Tax=Parerythrobacter aurantius TaxID=3127706 RepID=UPI003247315B